jgi:putative transcriptional regulator
VTRAAAFLAAAACCTVLAQEAPRGGALFLVADPSLTEPNFGKTVVLVARHAEVAGPIGVIINRPTAIAVERAFPDARKLAGSGDKLYVGGPVARHVFFYVLRTSEPPPDAVEVAEGVYLGWNPKHLKALLERDKPLEGLRIYAGHAAWAPGQLEAEVAHGFWKSARPDARSIFATRPENLWPELIRRASATPVRLRHSAGDHKGGSTWH